MLHSSECGATTGSVELFVSDAMRLGFQGRGSKTCEIQTTLQAVYNHGGYLYTFMVILYTMD